MKTIKFNKLKMLINMKYKLICKIQKYNNNKNK